MLMFSPLKMGRAQSGRKIENFVVRAYKDEILATFSGQFGPNSHWRRGKVTCRSPKKPKKKKRGRKKSLSRDCGVREGRTAS